ncbi:MAG: phosphatase PAP2 family protein [Clostridia bacterium]|nr:phosphatase PAP2 family protein [Clostridia bacterium]
MKKETRFHIAAVMLTAFALWTAALRMVDVHPIGPEETAVGFAAVNQFFHRFTGVHMTLYTLTDWLSLVPLFLIVGFAALGAMQWAQRKQLLKVDRSILVLGGFYVIVLACYALFEVVVINYRPVLIDGRLEPSYPSSTTMLVLCVMPTACMQLRQRIKNNGFRRCVSYTIILFTILMVFLRLISGVHWLTDIIGGALLSAGLVLLYQSLS